MNSMNPMKRLLAKILAAGLIVTSIPVTDIHVYADTIPETLTLSEESSGDNLILPEELSGTEEGQPAGIITEADGQQVEPLTVAPAEDSILSGDALNDASDDVLSGRVSGDYADDMLLSWQSSLNDIDENTGNDTDPGYVEGDVIVCINESYDGDRKSYAAEGYGTAGTVDRTLSLLDGAEELMDVTRAVNESGLASGQTEEAGELKENNPESGPAASKDSALPADDEEYTIKYIHSDIYSTGQMIEMLEAMPEVLFAEPN